MRNWVLQYWSSQWLRRLRSVWQWRRVGLLVLPLLLLVSSCSLPQVKAEDRLFLNLSLDFLGAYPLPKQDFQGTKVGGLSGLTYDRQRNRFYAVSDDRSNFAPARFYTLKLDLTQLPEAPGIQQVTVESVTTLTDEKGQPFAAGTVDLEGIALSPRQSFFIASEGVAEQGIAPFIDEFDRDTGAWRSRLPIAKRYRPEPETGVQNNLGFESLTVNPDSYSNPQLEPFRLFAATESALVQDLAPPADPDSSEPVVNASTGTPIRFLHYLVGENQAPLIAEHLYVTDPLPAGAENLGLSELLILDQGGHFLGLERSFGLAGFGGKIFQLAIGGATDIAALPRLSGDTTGITPIFKRPLLDLSDLGIPLDNFEAITLGPQLPDGSQSLVLVSDDNFNDLQTTEFLLFRLKQGR
jgi:hypothetical protein